MRFRFACCFACCISLAALAEAQEWTRFRGPNGAGGIEDDSIPAQWTEADFNWKIELPGRGHSSPVLWGDKLFILSADPDTAMRYVLGIDARSGKILWKNEYAAGTHKLHGKSNYATSSPTVDADRVYAVWSDNEHTSFCAFDHDGKELWRQDLGGWVGQHGFGTSPVVVGDLVVVTSSQESEVDGDPTSRQPRHSFVAALDRKTGEIRWRKPLTIEVASYSVPAIRKGADGRDELICCSTAEGIFALDPATGKQNWSSGKVFSKRTVSSPQLWKDLIVGTTGSGGGGNYAVAFRPGDDQPAYEIKKEAPYVPTPIIYQDRVFLWSDNGIVTCVKADSGREVWQQRVGGKYSGSPVRAGNKIFCTDESGTVVVIAAANKYQELGRNELGELSHSTPAIAGGKIYVRTVSHLYSIGGKKS
jgi:outer membrane protein assembly factor BamB